MKKVWVAFGVWCAIVLFVPMAHTLPIPQDLLDVAAVFVCLPWIALAILLYLHYRPESFLTSWITIDIATGIILVITFGLLLHLIITNVHSALTWAYPTTLITVALLMLMLMRKYAGGGGVWGRHKQS